MKVSASAAEPAITPPEPEMASAKLLSVPSAFRVSAPAVTVARLPRVAWVVVVLPALAMSSPRARSPPTTPVA